MEKSVGSAIEKIKLQELNAEIKLKEKREFEGTIVSLNRSIRDTTTLIEKSEQDQVELGKRIGKLRCQVGLDNIRREALLDQIGVSRKELEDMKHKSDEGISNVWRQRSSICSAVQKVTDNYDIWALLMKPVSVAPLPEVKRPVKEEEYAVQFEEKLKDATKRRDGAIDERERLLNEPETGEEFTRIKNALKYSLEKVASLRNN